MLPWIEHAEDTLFLRSRSMPAPWGPVLRVLRYPTALIRDWIGGELNIRAMSLAYTTLLSLVPLIVFSFAILKGVGAPRDLRILLDEFFRPIGAAGPQLTESVLQFVANMRGELLGSIGLAFLIYTVFATIQKVEGSFNYVWHVGHTRHYGRRFAEYMSVMIMGPILLTLAIGLLGSAEHSAWLAEVASIAPLSHVVPIVQRMVSYVLVATVFTFMYAFIPNTRVEIKPALIGGVAAGVIWALVGRAFTTLIAYSSQMVAVYTGFAIVLTTLIWVYVSWLILLVGAQLAFYVQSPQYLRHGHQAVDLAASDLERAALSVMALIGKDYESGRRYWSPARLAEKLDVPGVALVPVLSRLEQAGLIVATEKEQFVPGRETDQILLVQILEAVRSVDARRLKVEVRGVDGANRTLNEAEAAVRAKLGTATLRQLIGEHAQQGDLPI